MDARFPCRLLKTYRQKYRHFAECPRLLSVVHIVSAMRAPCSHSTITPLRRQYVR